MKKLIQIILILLLVIHCDGNGKSLLGKKEKSQSKELCAVSLALCPKSYETCKAEGKLHSSICDASYNQCIQTSFFCFAGDNKPNAI